MTADIDPAATAAHSPGNPASRRAAAANGAHPTDLHELQQAMEAMRTGDFSVRLPEVSSAILGKKLDNVERTGADCVVACDAGCLMQMGGGLSRRRSRVRALHLAQVLTGEDKG